MTIPLSVVVIDDNPAEREHTCGLLAAARLRVVASAGHGVGASAAIREHRPDIVFVSIEEPFLRSLQVLHFIEAALPDATVVGYSTATGVSVFQQAIRAGAKYLLPAPLAPAHLRPVLDAFDATPAKLAPGRTGRVIAVVGQKGGIGKTAISVNLASALATDTHAGVLIIDFDMAFGDVGLSLDIRADVTTAQLARNAAEIDKDSFKESLIKHQSGAFVLPAPAHVGEWLNVRPDELETLVSLGAALFDYVIVDTPGAYNDALAAGVAVADHLMVTTSLEMTSVKNTALLLDVLRSEAYPAERIIVIANHTTPDTGLEAIDVTGTLGLDAIWEVPFDGQMRRASQDGHALVLTQPESPAAASLRALARRIAIEPERIDRRARVRRAPGKVVPSLRERLGVALARVGLAEAG